jgi:hypothetical protein
MEIPSTLAADLEALTEALDPPRIDLAVQLHRVIADVRMTHPSYLGLALTVVNGGVPYTIVTFVDDALAADVRASAHLPLPALCDVEDGSGIVFYAGVSGAFAEFADDVVAGFGLADDVVELDRHLSPSVAANGLSAIRGSQQMNQALGVLIDRGFEPAAARGELLRLSEQDGADPLSAPMRILDSAADGDAPDERLGR